MSLLDVYCPSDTTRKTRGGSKQKPGGRSLPQNRLWRPMCNSFLVVYCTTDRHPKSGGCPNLKNFSRLWPGKTRSAGGNPANPPRLDRGNISPAGGKGSPLSANPPAYIPTSPTTKKRLYGNPRAFGGGGGYLVLIPVRHNGRQGTGNPISRKPNNGAGFRAI